MHHLPPSNAKRTALGIAGIALMAAALTGGGVLAQGTSPVPESGTVSITDGSGISQGGAVIVGGGPVEAGPAFDQAGPGGPCGSWQTVTIGPDGSTQRQGGDSTCAQGGPVVIDQFGPGVVAGGVPMSEVPGMVTFGDDPTRLVTVTGVDGSTVSLVTTDGWTRDLDTTNVVITLDRATLTASDLAVGDTVQVDQTRNANDTYTITGLEVVLPQVAGIVVTVGTDSFSLTQPDGTTTTVHVSDTTKWPGLVPGQSATGPAGLKAGDPVFARGKLRTDGSMDAVSVESGGMMTSSGMGGPTITVTPVVPAPATTPAPSASPKG